MAADSSVSAPEGSSDRGQRRSLALLVVSATSMVALLMAGAPAAAAAPNNYLSAVQCPSANSCFAVGDYGTSTLEYNSLAEHWNGTAWATRTSPSWQSTGDGIFVNGLSCASKIVCWAVGGYVTPQDVSAAFAMRWNGNAWQLGDPPDPSAANNSFESMYCLTTLYCLAAGYYTNNDGFSAPLIDAYSVTPKIGVRWSVLTVPAPTGRVQRSSLRSAVTVRRTAMPSVTTRTRRASTCLWPSTRTADHLGSWRRPRTRSVPEVRTSPD